MDATRALFEGLIDYAGLFPPAELDMAAATEEYGALRGGAWAWMSARFIVPASRLPELRDALEDSAPAPYGLSVVVDAGSDPRAWLNNTQRLLDVVAREHASGGPIRVEALEVPVPAPAAARDTYDSVIGQFGMLAQNAGLRTLPVYVELPRTPGWAALLPGAMAALERAKFRAKIRCGGVVAAAFPSSEQIAGFVAASYDHGIPFKATAGLHHPVRHHDPGTGFTMHGFLNLLAAATFVRSGAGSNEIVEMLEEQDPAAFSVTETFNWRSRSASLQEIQTTRAQGFVSYGSCSFDEPVGDLIALHMLEPSGTPA